MAIDRPPAEIGDNSAQKTQSLDSPSARPNPPHLLALLLRAHRERPRGCRAAEQRDELPPLHVWMAPAGLYCPNFLGLCVSADVSATTAAVAKAAANNS